MTLKELGFVLWHVDSAFGLKNTVYYRRLSFFRTYYEMIKFDLKDREYSLTNIDSVDMILNVAIQEKLVELELI